MSVEQHTAKLIMLAHGSLESFDHVKLLTLDVIMMAFSGQNTCRDAQMLKTTSKMSEMKRTGLGSRQDDANRLSFDYLKRRSLLLRLIQAAC